MSHTPENPEESFTRPTRTTQPRAPQPGRHSQQNRRTFPTDDAEVRPASGTAGTGYPRPQRAAEQRPIFPPPNSAGQRSEGGNPSGRPFPPATQPATSQPAATQPAAGQAPHTFPPAPASAPTTAASQPYGSSSGQTPQPGPQPGMQPGPQSAPARRERRGPGWGALTLFTLMAVLLGGLLGAGTMYGMQALGVGSQQGQSEATTADPPQRTQETPDWATIAETASQSVAAIQVGVNGQVQGLGSGFVYDSDGHIVTNNHVIAAADTGGGQVNVVFNNGDTIEAEIVGRDPETDIAVLKLRQNPDGLTPLPIGDDSQLSVGDPVMALGNPLGLADTVTTGIVSALNRPVTTENIGEDTDDPQGTLTITNAIQTDAAINPGNSGGPLVDGNGNLIGVNSAAATLRDAQDSGQQSGSIGIGFAIPVTQAKNIADQLISNGSAEHTALGVAVQDSQVDHNGIARGSAKVSEVEDGSAAAQAGIQPDDEIIAVDDTPVNNSVALQALIRSYPINQTVTVTLVRGGQKQQMDVTLQTK